MKHFITAQQFDTNVDVLENRRDYEMMHEATCKICGFQPSKIRKEALALAMKDIANEKMDVAKPMGFEYYANPQRYTIEKADRHYEKLMEGKEECPSVPSVIKTRDMEFVNFLVANGFKVEYVTPLGRERMEASSSSQTTQRRGFFSSSSTTKSSSHAESERRDIAEYTMIKHG